jgi:hypothetical protein
LSSAYKELFRIECSHGYFPGGLCPILEVTPTSRCARLLQRNRFLFRGSAGIGSVYHSDPEFLKTFSETSPFGFVLAAPAMQLTQCTEMNEPAASPDAHVWYFSNLVKRDDNLLHTPGRPFEDGALPVRRRPPSPIAGKSDALIDMLGNPVPNPEEEGRYQLKAAAAGQSDFYLSTIAPPERWGVVEIFPPSGSIWSQPVIFTISLPARASIWRYYIVSQSPADRAFDQHHIETSPRRGAKSNGVRPVEFTAPQPRNLNGKAAWVFESTELIPLCQYPAERGGFLLKGDGPFPGIPLPHAQVENTRLERNAESGAVRACSEIFVYL